jgi:hypothetical protein
VTKNLRVIVFKRRLGWYWKLQAHNNRTIAIGGEPFSSPRSAKRSFDAMYDALYANAWTFEVRHG